MKCLGQEEEGCLWPKMSCFVKSVKLLPSCTSRDQEISELGPPSFNQSTASLLTLDKNSKEIDWCWQGLIFISAERCNRELLHSINLYQVLTYSIRSEANSIWPVTWRVTCRNPELVRQPHSFHSGQLSG